MNVFDLRDEIVDEYARFVGSFVDPCTEDVAARRRLRAPILAVEPYCSTTRVIGTQELRPKAAQGFVRNRQLYRIR